MTTAALAASVSAAFLVLTTGGLVASAGRRAVAGRTTGRLSGRLPDRVRRPAATHLLLRVRAVVLATVTTRRTARLVDRALPGALEEVARSLRAGCSVRQAIAEAGAATPSPLGEELVAVATTAERGVPLAAALDDWATRHPVRGIRLAVAALGMAAASGGPSARAVDGVAATLRDRLAVDREVAALSSQARASAVVIAVAPVVFGFVAAATDPRTAGFLFGTGAGVACLAGGLALDAVGAWWMARILGRHR